MSAVRNALLLIAALLALWCVAARAQMPQPFPDNAPASLSCTAVCTLQISTSGYTQVSVEASGTGSGLTFAVEGKQTNGAAWHALPAVVLATPGTFVTSMSANGAWLVGCAGWQLVRVNLTVIGGGTETFSVAASVGNNVGLGK